MNKFLTYKFFDLEQVKVFSTTRVAGSVKTNGKLKLKNLEKAMKLNNLKPKNLVLPEQIHGSKIEMIKNASIRLIPGKDGLVTKSKNIFLGVITADCIPLVFYSPKNRTLGILHAGYKGILQGILNEMIIFLKENGESLKDIKIFMGPSICFHCYEVSMKIIDDFSKTFINIENFFLKKEGKYFLDLKAVAREVLIMAGFSKINIEFSSLCTKENSSFLYSARKSKNKTFGEFATIVGMI